MSASPLSPIASQIEWAGSNFAYNLGFVPADKLGWKPGPDASSALEIAHHAANTVRFMHGMMMGDRPEPLPAFTSCEEAQAAIRKATSEYAAYARTITEEQAAANFDTKFMGEMPFGQFAIVPAFDFVHHHGQIAYIQILLGDTESHFEMMGS